MFDLVDSSIQRGPNSIVFGKFFRLNCFRPGFCLELETYRPFELGSIIFKSIKQELRKKLDGNYKLKTFRVRIKDGSIYNFRIIGQLQFILVPLEQKLSKLSYKVIVF